MYKFLVAYLLISLNVFPQPVSTNFSLSDKYFHFRKRLVNEFTLGIGNGFGQSIPASVRNSYDRSYNGEHTILWGDATIDLAYYTGILATEYLLLSKQNQLTEKTLQELYYALEAFNRLDYYAEEYFGFPPSLNGFFVRSDVGRGLYDQKYKNKNYADVLKSLNFNVQDSVNNIESEWLSNYLYHDEKRFAVSKDQVFHLLLAMRLVVKCIPENVHYDNFLFRDNEITFVKEAKNITDRIMQWIHPSDKSNFISNWSVKQPNRKKVGAGNNSWSFAHGMSQAQHEISGTKNPKQNGVSWWLAKAVYNFTWLAFKPIYFFNRSEALKTLSLVAINNSCKGNVDKLYKYSFMSKKYPGYHIPLVYCFLYGKISKQVDITVYKKMFDEVPVDGPHNTRWNGFSNYNWSSTSLIIHPERRGQLPGFFPGAYNAIDYMFMYNLYLLCFDKKY